MQVKSWGERPCGPQDSSHWIPEGLGAQAARIFPSLPILKLCPRIKESLSLASRWSVIRIVTME